MGQHLAVYKMILQKLPEIGGVVFCFLVHQRYVDSLVADFLAMKLGDGIASLVSRGHPDEADVGVVGLRLNTDTLYLLGMKGKEYYYNPPLNHKSA